MDIARLGVQIDPAGAVAGAARVTQALTGMGAAATRETGRVTAGMNAATQAANRTAQARGGFIDLSRGLMDAADAAGVLNNGFGALLRRADSAIRAAQQLGAMHRASAVSASANAVANGRAAAAIQQVTTAQWAQAAASAASGNSARAAASAISSAGSAAGVAGISIGALVGIAAAALAAILALVGGFMALSKAISLVREGMDLAGPTQLTRISLTTMTGSASEANRILKELSATTMKTGADINASMGTVKRFIALGFSPDNAIKMNKSIMDIAGSVGLTTEEAKGLGMALAQVQAKGVVSMEELRQQIAEKGVPVFGELAKKLGVTTMQLNKMVGDGKVASKELIDLFLNMEGGFAKFAGGAEKATVALPNAIARVSGTWKELLAAMGEPVNVAIAPLVNKLANALAKMLPAATAIGTAIGNAITALTKAAEIGQIGELLGLALKAAIEQAASLMVTNFQVATIAVIKGAITLGSSAIAFVVDTASSLLTAMFEFVRKLVIGDFSGAFATVVNFFGNLFKGGSGVLGNIAKEIYNALGAAFERIVNAFYVGFMRVWSKIADVISEGRAQLNMDPMAPVPIPKPLDFFTPEKVSWQDLIKASDAMVGTGARDALSEKFKSLLPPEFVGPPAPTRKTNAETVEIALPDGTVDKGGAEKSAKDAIKAAEAVETETSKMLEEWGNMAKQIDHGIASLGQSIAGNLGTAIQGLIEGTMTAKQAFSGMANSIISDIIRIVTQMTIQLAVQRALQAAGYAGFGSAQIAHTGGTVGTNLATIPKYHSGGTLSSEQTVKVDRGETILTRRRAAELTSELAASRGQREAAKQTGQSGNATIINVLDRNEIADAVARNPGAVVNAMSRALPQVRKMILSGNRA